MAKVSKQYWIDRQLQTFNEGEELALNLSKKLKANYDLAIAEIERDLNAFYGKLARANGITIAEAKKLLDKSELKNFAAQLQDYAEYAEAHGFDPAYLKELNVLKYKHYVSRLEELKARIKFQLMKLTNKNYDEILEEMLDEYDMAYLHNIFDISKQVGLSISFTRPAINVITKYLTQSLNISNYSISKESMWKYKIPQLMEILNIKIPQGIVLGQNPKTLAKTVSKTLDTDFNNTVRLIRTEYNHIFNEASFDAYKECGLKQYQILATLDERTCTSCGPLDLKVVDMKDKEVGVNFPPFHPNCRCTTIAYFEPDEFDIGRTRVARDKDGKSYKVPYDLTFAEWKNGLTKHEGGVEYWKPKGE